eukprot:6200451-Pleurochrysis_carterae.AAC.4
MGRRHKFAEAFPPTPLARPFTRWRLLTLLASRSDSDISPLSTRGKESNGLDAAARLPRHACELGAIIFSVSEVSKDVLESFKAAIVSASGSSSAGTAVVHVMQIPFSRRMAVHLACSSSEKPRLQLPKTQCTELPILRRQLVSFSYQQRCSSQHGVKNVVPVCLVRLFQLSLRDKTASMCGERRAA